VGVSVDRDVKRLVDHAAGVPLVIVLVVVGGILRLMVAGQDLFADELSTYWIVSTHGLSGVVRTVSTTAEITPPLSFVLSWLTTRIGLSPELVRLPALVAGIGSIPLVYAVGARTVGRGPALLAAALTTLSPFMIFYSAEARGYGVLMALVLLSTLALLHALDGGRRRWWAAYAACVCLAAYTHYTAVFVLAAQLGWAFWVHPRARRSLLLATSVAVVLYLPWLPSLKGDLDSPTTDILSALSPFDLKSARLTLGHWALGFPAVIPRTALGVLPGVPALLLLTASLAVGAYGILTTRSKLGPWSAAHGGRIGLVVLLALATPVGTALQSAVGANVFSTRSLAASWPYLALTVAALVSVGKPALRLTAAALAITAFAVSATKIGGTHFQRPHYSQLAHYADTLPGGVIVDGAAFAPGGVPLTNFDIEGSTPNAQVFQLFVTGQTPAMVVQRAAAASEGGPITVITFAPLSPVIAKLINQLPEGYVLTHTELAPGIFDLQALVYERSPTS